MCGVRLVVGNHLVDVFGLITCAWSGDGPWAKPLPLVESVDVWVRVNAQEWHEAGHKMTMVRNKLIFLSHDTRSAYVRENVSVWWDVLFTTWPFRRWVIITPGISRHVQGLQAITTFWQSTSLLRHYVWHPTEQRMGIPPNVMDAFLS